MLDSSKLCTCICTSSAALEVPLLVVEPAAACFAKLTSQQGDHILLMCCVVLWFLV
jgi:hypothetical protein